MCERKRGSTFALAGRRSLIIILSVRTLKKVATLRGHPREVVSFSFDPLDKTLVSVGEDGKVCEWSTETWSSMNEYSSHGTHGEALAIATCEGKVWACVAEAERSAFRSFSHGVYHESQDMVFHSSEQLVSMDLFAGAHEAREMA